MKEKKLRDHSKIPCAKIADNFIAHCANPAHFPAVGTTGMTYKQEWFLVGYSCLYSHFCRSMSKAAATKIKVGMGCADIIERA